MGRQFGNTGYTVRGVITYSLSPFEQRAFAGMISHSIPNMIRRIRSQIFRVVPPFVIAYCIYSHGEKVHSQLQRKNPADYADEV